MTEKKEESAGTTIGNNGCFEKPPMINLKAKWTSENRERVDTLTKKTNIKKQKEKIEMIMNEMKSRIWSQLKTNNRSEHKMGLLYDFLNKNILMMGDKFNKLQVKKEQNKICLEKYNDIYKMSTVFIQYEDLIFQKLFTTCKVLQ